MATTTPDFIDRRHMPDRRTDVHHMEGQRMKAAEWIPMVLLLAGGLNWGLIGLFHFDLVAYLFGDMSPVTRVVYVAVGLSALYSLYMASRLSRRQHE
jgi:uncharacterized membrane protein YuzA (DUF378 family)